MAKRKNSRENESCVQANTRKGRPAAATAGQHCRIIRRRGMNNATPPPKGIDEQPLAVSCGEIRNMHMGARYAAAVDTGVNQPCHRPKVIAASNADCKLPLASPNPLSVAVAGPSARLLTQREI